MSGYWGAERSRRFRHFTTTDRGPNSLLSAEGERLRARARQLARGTSQAAAGKQAAETHVVGEGIKPRSMHPDKDTAKRVDAVWARMVPLLDADGVDDFYGLQATVAGADFVDGEVFVRRRLRRPEDGVPLQLQVLEADLLPLNNLHGIRPIGEKHSVIGGIETDLLGRRLAYHFFKAHPRDDVDWRRVTDAVMTHPVPAAEVLHIFKRMRPGQMRGETRLAPVIEAIWQLSQYSVSEMDRAGLASRLNIFLEQGAADDSTGLLPAFGERATETETSAANPTSDGTLDVNLEAGEVPVLEPGQTLKSVEVKQDAAGFEKFALQKHHEIGAGCSTPYELLTGDFSRTNFASARTSLRAFQRIVQQVQRRLTVQFNNPVWAWVIDAAFASGELKDPKFPANRADYLAVDWTAPRVEFVDPLKELQAYALAVEQGFMSREQVIEELGYDPNVVNERIARDKLRAMGPSSFGTPKTTPPAEEQESQEALLQ